MRNRGKEKEGVNVSPCIRKCRKLKGRYAFEVVQARRKENEINDGIKE